MPGEKLGSLFGHAERVTLPDGEVVHVRPFTLDELALMDSLEPGEMSGYQYASLRLWCVMRNVPGYECEYAEWKEQATGEVLGKLQGVLDAVARVNATFRPRDVARASPPAPPAR